MRGKSIFLWQRWAVDGGDPGKIARRLQDLNMGAVLIKTVEGTRRYRHWRHGDNATPELIEALKNVGIEPWGWSFCYGNDWRGEGEIAAIEVNRLGLAGHVFDVEGHFLTQPKAVDRAPAMIMAYKLSASTKPAGFISFALYEHPRTGGRWHPEDVFREAMEYADFGMPMTYWFRNHSVAAYREPGPLVAESVAQWRRITGRPIIPIGRAYDGEGDVVDPSDYDNFYEACIRGGALSWSFWSLQHVPQRTFELLASIPKKYTGDPPLPTVEERLVRLEKAVFGSR